MQQTPLQNNSIDTQVVENIHGTILPSEKTQAMQTLIKLTKSLSDLAERESQALMQNDMLSFAILQDEKTMIAERYAQASSEFRSRLNEFRGISPALLSRLESLQAQLGEISQQNNAIVARLYDQSRQNTQSTLLKAQELGQNTQITYANNNTAEDERNA